MVPPGWRCGARAGGFGLVWGAPTVVDASPGPLLMTNPGPKSQVPPSSHEAPPAASGAPQTRTLVTLSWPGAPSPLCDSASALAADSDCECNTETDYQCTANEGGFLFPDSLMRFHCHCGTPAAGGHLGLRLRLSLALHHDAYLADFKLSLVSKNMVG